MTLLYRFLDELVTLGVLRLFEVFLGDGPTLTMLARDDVWGRSADWAVQINGERGEKGDLGRGVKLEGCWEGRVRERKSVGMRRGKMRDGNISGGIGKGKMKEW